MEEIRGKFFENPGILKKNGGIPKAGITSNRDIFSQWNSGGTDEKCLGREAKGNLFFAYAWRDAIYDFLITFRINYLQRQARIRQIFEGI